MARSTHVSDASRVFRPLSRPAFRQVHLEYRQVLTVRGDARGSIIRALGSVLWITQDGDPDDHILNPGEAFVITSPGAVVIQGMRLPSA